MSVKPSVPKMTQVRRVVAVFRTREHFEREELIEYGLRHYRFAIVGAPSLDFCIAGPRHHAPIRDVGFKVVDFYFTGKKDAYGRWIYEEA